MNESWRTDEAPSSGPGLDRRRFVKLSAAGAFGAVLAPSVLAACATSGGGGGGGPLGVQVFSTGLEPANKLLPIFKQQYGRSATAQTVATDYYTITKTRLLGGKPPFDVLDFDAGYLKQFTENGWIANLEGLPNVDKLKADMYPDALASLTGSDGKLMGLPRYTNVVSMFFNEKILSKHGLKPAVDWNELVDQGKFLKTKGVESPIVPVWTSKYNLTNAMFIAECISRGMPAQFDANLDPLWDKDPIALDVLNFWRQLQDNKLVPPDATTIDHNQSASVMQAGQGAYFWFNSYVQKDLNNKDTSAVAGDIRVSMMPGTTRGSSTFSAPTFQSLRHAREEAWPLTSFMSGLDKEGKYTGPVQRGAIATGALLGYKSTAADPEILKAWSAWRNSDDLAVLSKQLESAKGEGAVLNASWYPDYGLHMTTTLSKYLARQISAEEALSSTAKYVRTLKK